MAGPKTRTKQEWQRDLDAAYTKRYKAIEAARIANQEADAAEDAYAAIIAAAREDGWYLT